MHFVSGITWVPSDSPKHGQYKLALNIKRMKVYVFVSVGSTKTIVCDEYQITACAHVKNITLYRHMLVAERLSLDVHVIQIFIRSNIHVATANIRCIECDA